MKIIFFQDYHIASSRQRSPVKNAQIKKLDPLDSGGADNVSQLSRSISHNVLSPLPHEK